MVDLATCILFLFFLTLVSILELCTVEAAEEPFAALSLVISIMNDGLCYVATHRWTVMLCVLPPDQHVRSSPWERRLLYPLSFLSLLLMTILAFILVCANCVCLTFDPSSMPGGNSIQVSASLYPINSIGSRRNC